MLAPENQVKSGHEHQLCDHFSTVGYNIIINRLKL